uniref:Uncharacterized protein n=1 Tax=Arundo donax TaxID=35708 RepID=A0A0A9GBD7_ARUDO
MGITLICKYKFKSMLPAKTISQSVHHSLQFSFPFTLLRHTVLFLCPSFTQIVHARLVYQ